MTYSISGYICVPYFFTVNKKECDDYPGEEVPEDDAEEVTRRRQRNKPAKLRDYRSGKWCCCTLSDFCFYKIILPFLYSFDVISLYLPQTPQDKQKIHLTFLGALYINLRFSIAFRCSWLYTLWGSGIRREQHGLTCLRFVCFGILRCWRCKSNVGGSDSTCEILAGLVQLLHPGIVVIHLIFHFRRLQLRGQETKIARGPPSPCTNHGE